MKYACFQCLRGKHSSEAQHNKDLGDILRSTYKNQWCTPHRAITLPVLLPWDMWKVREDGLLTLLANRKHESHLLLLIVHLLGKNDSSTWGPPSALGHFGEHLQHVCALRNDVLLFPSDFPELLPSHGCPIPTLLPLFLVIFFITSLIKVSRICPRVDL